MIDRLAALVTRHAWVALLLTLAVTVASIGRLVDVTALGEGRLAEVLRLQIDPSMSSVLPREDEGRVYHERMRAVFGNDETLMVAVRTSDGVFQTEALRALARATEQIEAVDGIRTVMSLANAPNIRSQDGELIVAPLYEEPPTDPAALAALESELGRNPVLASSLLSADGRTTAIVAYLRDMTELEFMARGIDHALLEIAKREFGPDTEVFLSGGAHVKAETQRTLLTDLLTVMPLSVLVLLVVAFLSFRTLRGVLLPLITLGLAIVWTLAIAAIFFPKLNLVTISAPAILLGVGFAYAIHVVSAYYEVVGERQAAPVRAGAEPPVSAAREAVRRVGLATLLTGLTTGVGFVSLATSPITAIQEFGLLCGIGVFCLMVTTLTFAPAVLHLLPEKAPERPARAEGGDRIDRLLRRLGRFDVERRGLILWVGVGLALLSIASIPRITLSTNVLDNFPEDLPVRQSIDAINEHLGAADQLYVVLETDYKNAFKEPENLRLVAELQTWLDRQPEVGGSTSLVDYVKLINRGFHDDDPEFFRIPESKRMVTQLLFFGANDEIKRLVNSQYQIASIPVRVRVFNSSQVVAFADRVEAFLADLPERVTGRVTGLSVLVARTNDDIAYGQALSLLSAFVVIYGILALLFMSFRVGLMAMIPNVLPVVIYFGALGLSGITLNVTTGLVACLVLGIAVDDTIHFFARFNTLAKERADSKEGAREALLEVGRPVTYTTAALCLGFLAITASTLQQQVEFGGLAAFTLAVAWVVDITFTPALASGMRIVTLWDLVSLDLGEDPHHSIGLFEGLRAGQARLVALMGTLVDAPAGQSLFHAGERAEGLFVVIAGKVRTWKDAHDQNLGAVLHERGDTIGEVGLFHGEHALHAEVVEEARLLRLTQGSMEQLARRYPRIAAVVFGNTNRLLAGRLAFHTTGQTLVEAFDPRHTADRVLAGDFHLGDEALRESLIALGIAPQTQRALGLIPLVQVAWADGTLADKEREAILQAAEALGVDRGGESHALLSEWLAAPPDPGLFETWREYVATLLPQLSVEGKLRLKDNVVARAKAVAEAAGGVVGLRSVSRHEEGVIGRLESVFEDPSI